MNDAILILYGSRARGDARPGADVDLMLATDASRPEQPIERRGVSLHRYPSTWLLQQAAGGDLFAYHVGHEGVPLQDGEGFLADLRSSFRRRETYLPDVRVGILVARMVAEQDWKIDVGLRRRFFWGMRTCAIALTAEAGAPKFSARSLEGETGVVGLADVLDRRDTAEFEECRSLLRRVENALAWIKVPPLEGDALQVFLEAEGGYPAECARALDRSRWEDAATVITYA